MTTLESRLAKLEADRRAKTRPDDPRGVAMQRLFDALYEALPYDPWPEPEHRTADFWKQVGSTYRSSLDKIIDLADRITAGEISDEDRQVLEGLPHDALECLDMTAQELVTMITRAIRSVDLVGR